MKSSRNHFRIISSMLIGFILTGICIWGSFFAFTSFYNYTYNAIESDYLRRKNPNISETSLRILANTTVDEISKTLYENNIISNPYWFILEAKLYKYPDVLKPGTYSISSNMSNTEILDLLTTDKSTKKTLKFTIPEGFSIEQIAQRLEDEKIVSQKDFLKAVSERSYDFAFLKNVPQDAKYPLEVYLFPDTYTVREGVTPEEIIIMMLNRFEQVSSQYTQQDAASLYSFHDIITIASIIEQEAQASEERPIISGVIYNRLGEDMKLQMCSTVQYVLQKRKAALSYDDLKIESPYNTYVYDGLPVGPICSPGEDSIKAAFMPEQHNYFFFVLKGDDTGTHSFSRTASEHEYNKNKYVQTVDKNFIE